jgi:hypothetical protein
LPETSGFFFGASKGAETEDELAFVAQAAGSAGQRPKTVFGRERAGFVTRQLRKRMM